MQTAAKGPRKSDKYIPWIIVGFFAVLFAWDGYFVYLATSTHTGVVEDNTYNRGLNYNETVAAAEAQQALGWESSVKYDETGLLTVAVKDAEGEALTGATIKAYFFRPTQAGHDFLADLNEAEAGTYNLVRKPSVGQWEVRIFVAWKQQRYQTTTRILVQTP